MSVSNTSACHHHRRLAAIWLVTGTGMALVLGLVLIYGFDTQDSPAPLLAWVGAWGAAYHLYWRARLQGRRRPWLFALVAALGPLPALAVYSWLRYGPNE